MGQSDEVVIIRSELGCVDSCTRESGQVRGVRVESS